MRQYFLKHRNDRIALIGLSDDCESVLRVKPIAEPSARGPFFGNISCRNIQMWWKSRAIPGSREHLQIILNENHCLSAGEYLAKNLALSLTDTYWICPIEFSDLHWEDVSLFSHMDGEKLESYGHSVFQSASSLNGQMKKYWKRVPNESVPGKIDNFLIKRSGASEGQQNINEAFAAWIHSRQGLRTGIDYVDYQVLMEEGMSVGSCCPAFTSEQKELVYAMEFLYAGKNRNEESMFEALVRVAAEHGLEAETVRKNLEYMLATDFILSNQDRHLLNFGFLRDPESLRLLGPAPLYDTGNSMYWNNFGIKGRLSLLNEETNGFAMHSAHLLKYVRNRFVVDADRLPTRRETEEFYRSYGVSEARAQVIAENFARKVDLFRQFQQGESFNLYQEKKNRRMEQGMRKENDPPCDLIL